MRYHEVHPRPWTVLGGEAEVCTSSKVTALLLVFMTPCCLQEPNLWALTHCSQDATFMSQSCWVTGTRISELCTWTLSSRRAEYRWARRPCPPLSGDRVNSAPAILSTSWAERHIPSMSPSDPPKRPPGLRIVLIALCPSLVRRPKESTVNRNYWFGF